MFNNLDELIDAHCTGISPSLYASHELYGGT
jgi:hypothetical protein